MLSKKKLALYGFLNLGAGLFAAHVKGFESNGAMALITAALVLFAIADSVQK